MKSKPREKWSLKEKIFSFGHMFGWIYLMIRGILQGKKDDEDFKIAYGSLGLFALSAGVVSIISYQAIKRKRDQEEENKET